MANTVAWGLLKGDRWCMIVVCHWLKPAWQNMASLLSVVGSGIPHSMPQGGKSYHLIFKKPPLVRSAPGHGEIPDRGDLRGRLCIGRERRREQAQGERHEASNGTR